MSAETSQESLSFLIEHLARQGKIGPANAWMSLGDRERDAQTTEHTFFHPLLGSHVVTVTPDTLSLAWTPAWQVAPTADETSPLHQQAQGLVAQACSAATPDALAQILVGLDYLACGHLLGHGFAVQVVPSAAWSMNDPSPASAGLALAFVPALPAHRTARVDLAALLAPILPLWLDPPREAHGPWTVGEGAPATLPDVLADLQALGIHHQAQVWQPRHPASAPVVVPALPAPAIAAAIEAQDLPLLQAALSDGRLDPAARVPDAWRKDPISTHETARPQWLGYAYAQDKPQAFATLLAVTDPGRDPIFLSALLLEASRYADVAAEYWAPALEAPTLSFQPLVSEGGLSPALFAQAWLLVTGPGCPKATLIGQLTAAIVRVGGAAALAHTWDQAIGHLPGMDARGAYLAYRADAPGEALRVQLHEGHYDVALALMRRYPGCWKGIELAGQDLASVMTQRKAQQEATLQSLREQRADRTVCQQVNDEVRLLNQVLTVLRVAPRPRPSGP